MSHELALFGPPDQLDRIIERADAVNHTDLLTQAWNDLNGHMTREDLDAYLAAQDRYAQDFMDFWQGKFAKVQRAAGITDIRHWGRSGRIIIGEETFSPLSSAAVGSIDIRLLRRWPGGGDSAYLHFDEDRVLSSLNVFSRIGQIREDNTTPLTFDLDLSRTGVISLEKKYTINRGEVELTRREGLGLRAPRGTSLTSPQLS